MANFTKQFKSSLAKGNVKNQVKMTPAQKVLNVFPSFNEMMNDDKYGVQHLLHPMQRWAFSNSLQWEGVAMAVDNMCHAMFDRGFYTSYAINGDKGWAYVLPAFGDSIKVDADEFKALISILLILNMGLIQPTKKQYDAYLNFKGSDSRIYKILD